MKKNNFEIAEEAKDEPRATDARITADKPILPLDECFGDLAPSEAHRRLSPSKLPKTPFFGNFGSRLVWHSTPGVP